MRDGNGNGDFRSSAEVDFERSQCEKLEQRPGELGHRDGDNETPADYADKEHEWSHQE